MKGSPSRILIVDDQSFNIDALFIILKYKIGINSSKICDYCFDGLEAMKIIEEDVQEKKF
jgi:PleD family two-component response regulator